MSRTVFSFLIALVFAACQNQKAPAGQATEQAAPEEKAAPQATLPSVPLALLEKIWNEGTQVDLIFYNLPFTMSMDEKPAIQHTVRHIAEDPAPLVPGCQPMGRITFQAEGEILLEGDFYFSTGCTYYVFYEKQEKKYANYMTNEGINYFNQQIKQASQMQQKMQEGANGH